MTDTPLPAPSASGYQPVEGEGITTVNITARPSRQYQTVEVQLGYSFPQPTAYTDALPVLSDLWDQVSEEANQRLDELVAAKGATEVATIAQAVAQPTTVVTNAAIPQQRTAAAPAAGAGGWATGTKPNGNGTFEYLPTSVFPMDRFKDEATRLALETGLPGDQIEVWDDRSGNYGLESGNPQYSCGKVKAKKDTAVAAAAEGKPILASVSFNRDGSLHVHLNKSGEAVLAGLRMAAKFAPPEGAVGVEEAVPF